MGHEDVMTAVDRFRRALVQLDPGEREAVMLKLGLNPKRPFPHTFHRIGVTMKPARSRQRAQQLFHEGMKKLGELL